MNYKEVLIEYRENMTKAVNMALEEFGGNQTKARKFLGISHMTLRKFMDDKYKNKGNGCNFKNINAAQLLQKISDFAKFNNKDK